jgi:hypothetical protein
MNQNSNCGAFAYADMSGREVDRRKKTDTVVIVIQGGKVVQFDHRVEAPGQQGIDGDGI